MELRALETDDAELFRDLRLFALQESPEAFSSDVEREQGRTLSQVAERLGTDGEDRVFGAFEEGALLGVIGFYRDAQTKLLHRGHIWGMFVHPEHRGQGLGRALMREALTYARGLPGLLQVNLEVVTENTSALGLYESLGFERYGTERRGLMVGGRPLHEAMMVLPLAPFDPL